MADAPVAIVEQSGVVSYVRPQDVAAVQSEGARLATPAEVTDSQSRSGLGGAVATADGFVRGATFGASDYLQVEGTRALQGDAAAARIAEQTESLKRVHGEMAGLAELAGGFALPVPGGGAVRGVAEGVGMGLAGAAERGFGKGALSFAAEHVLPGALTGAYDGAVMGAGSALSEAALGNEQVTGEKLFAHAGKGAIFGGTLGGILGAGTGALQERFRPGGLTAAIERTGTRDAEAIEAAVVRGEERAAQAAGLPAAAARGEGVLAAAANQAEEQAFKATGAKIADYQKLGKTSERQAERVSGIGRRLIDEGIVTPFASKAEMAERVTAKVKSVGEELGSLRGEIEATGAKMDTKVFADRVAEEVFNPLNALPGTKSEAGAVYQYVKEFAELGGDRIDLKTAHEFRVKLDEKLKFDKLSAGATTEALRQVRTILEDEITKESTRIAETIERPGFAQQYATAKAAYSDLKTVQKILGKETAREGANRAISLTDTIAGATAFATMGPLGLLAAGANKAMREYGNTLGATVLDRVTKFEGAQRAAQAIDEAIGKGVQAFGKSGGKATKGGLALPRVSTAQAESVAKAVLTNPDTLTSRITEFVGGKLSDAAPAVANEVRQTATRAMLFLQQKAPHEPQPISPLQPNAGNRPPSRMELQKFSKYVEAVQDPTVVVTGIQSGHLSREHVEAVKAVYPKLYAVMQGRLQDEIAKLPKQLPYPTLVALSVLFDAPMTKGMEPAMVRGFQQQYAPPGAKGKGGKGPMGPAPLHIPKNLDVRPILAANSLATQRIERGT